LPPVVAKEI
nr:Chain C, HIV-1 PEPTIDE (LPPVVAKEI) [Human immunodeficiency virus 1]